jgi:PDZ domain-containing protein
MPASDLTRPDGVPHDGAPPLPVPSGRAGRGVLAGARRQVTVIVAAVLLVLLVLLAWLLPVPFAQERPGPTVDVLGSKAGTDFITVSGHRTYPTTGRLDLTTVSVTAPGEELPLLAMLAGWLSPRSAIVPTTYVYPPSLSVEQVQQQNAEEMDASQTSATAAALRQAGITVTDRVQILSIAQDAPAEGKLKAGDFVTTVDGTAIATPAELRSRIRAHKPGDRLTIGYRRGATAGTAEIVAGPAADDAKVAAIGVTPGVGYLSDVNASVHLPEQIGGPSAGMMFALGLYDKLTPGPLTGGRTIAGTGTIDANGTVGPIGGIKQKVNGARDAGATVFLAPASDCASAGSAGVDGITVYRVATLADSVTLLTELNANKPVTIPVCGSS